jgi:hypothetical protein
VSTNCPRFGSVNDILSKISRDSVRPRRSMKEPGSGLPIWRRAILRTPICPWASEIQEFVDELIGRGFAHLVRGADLLDGALVDDEDAVGHLEGKRVWVHVARCV